MDRVIAYCAAGRGPRLAWVCSTNSPLVILTAIDHSTWYNNK